MIRQSEVKSFINLITKMACKPEPKCHTIEDNQKQGPDHIYDSQHYHMRKEGETSQTFIKRYKSYEPIEKNGIFFDCGNESKHKTKKNVYEVYRESLQKKKQYLSNMVASRGKAKSHKNSEDFLLELDQQKTHSKQLYFPINRCRKSKDRKTSYPNMIKRKTILQAPNSVSCIESSTQKKLKSDKYQKNKLVCKDMFQFGNFNQTQKMRVKKLQFKPIFRVKKYNIENFKDQISNQLANNSEKEIKLDSIVSGDCYRCKIKTEPSFAEHHRKTYQKIIDKSIKYMKSRPILHPIVKLEGWEHDKQEGQQIF